MLGQVPNEKPLGIAKEGFFTGQMPFLLPNQQCQIQSTVGWENQ